MMGSIHRIGFLAAMGGIAVCALFSWDGTGQAAPAGQVIVQPEVTGALADAEEVRVLVKLRDPPAVERGIDDMAAARAQVAARQASVIGSVEAGDLAVSRRYQAIAAIAGTVNADGLRALAANPDVEAIEIDGEGYAATNQSRPLIHVPEVHTAGVTGEGVVVAVLDSGIDTDHPDLSDDIAYERCYLTPPLGCPGGGHAAEDDNGHGTNVSGVITSNGTIAPLGIAPDAKIAAYKILAASGGGIFSDWVAALDDIIANHPEVNFVNMSLQSTIPCGPLGATLETAVNTLRSQGVLTFIAAGNHGEKDLLSVPGCIAQAITVGASYDANIGTVNSWKADPPCTDTTTAADDVACWSDSASGLDVLAPGASISSAGFTGTTSTYYGTSQATPHAAAVAALLREAKPSLTPDEMENRLEATGKLVTDDLADGNGGTNRTTPRVDARAALLADSDDTDGDGCSNIEELGSNPLVGGVRNPLDPYDFFDVNGDKAVDLLNDIFAIAFAFGLDAGDAGYSQALDRSPILPGTNLWDLQAPDGQIDLLTDIFGAAYQFGHGCTAAP